MAYIRIRPIIFIQTASTTILFFIHCVTASPPSIRSSTQEICVEEEQPIGSIVGQIRGTHLTSASPRYTVYWPTTNPTNQDLEISESGLVRVATRLDRERRAWYQFVAVCGSPPGGLGGVACSIRVTVNVTDVNDNIPVFEKSFLVVNLSEAAPIGVGVVAVGNAMDRDAGANGTIRYRITGGNENGKFSLSVDNHSIQQQKLSLKLNSPLDFESLTSYLLTIRAEDEGTPISLHSDLTLQITVVDVNDNAPMFTQKRYSVEVPENVAVGREILRVLAVDGDSGENGRVTYSLDETRLPSSARFFSINPTTGKIFVHSPLDYEVTPFHELIILAKDNATSSQRLQTSAVASIRITNINDNPPVIQIAFLNPGTEEDLGRISSAAKPGDFVARLSVFDPDGRYGELNMVSVTLSDEEEIFSLTPVETGGYLLLLGESEGVLRILESKERYVFRVTAVDSGIPPLTATKSVFIDVVDKIVEVPVLDNIVEGLLKFNEAVYYTDLPVLSDPEYKIVTVAAEDQSGLNITGSIVYELQENLQEKDLHANFHIDSSSGLISTAKTLFCNASTSGGVIVVKVTARYAESRGAVAEAEVRIAVRNGEGPRFERSFYEFAWPENVIAHGDCFATVTAFDPDCGSGERKLVYDIRPLDSRQSATLDWSVDTEGRICASTGFKSSMSAEQYGDYNVTSTAFGGRVASALVRITHPKRLNASPAVVITSDDAAASGKILHFLNAQVNPVNWKTLELKDSEKASKLEITKGDDSSSIVRKGNDNKKTENREEIFDNENHNGNFEENLRDDIFSLGDERREGVLRDQGGPGNAHWALVGASVGGVLALGAVIATVLLCKRRRRHSTKKTLAISHGDSSSQSSSSTILANTTTSSPKGDSKTFEYSVSQNRRRLEGSQTTRDTRKGLNRKSAPSSLKRFASLPVVEKNRPKSSTATSGGSGIRGSSGFMNCNKSGIDETGGCNIEATRKSRRSAADIWELYRNRPLPPVIEINQQTHKLFSERTQPLRKERSSDCDDLNSSNFFLQQGIAPKFFQYVPDRRGNSITITPNIDVFHPSSDAPQEPQFCRIPTTADEDAISLKMAANHREYLARLGINLETICGGNGDQVSLKHGTNLCDEDIQNFSLNPSSRSDHTNFRYPGERKSVSGRCYLKEKTAEICGNIRNDVDQHHSFLSLKPNSFGVCGGETHPKFSVGEFNRFSANGKSSVLQQGSSTSSERVRPALLSRCSFSPVSPIRNFSDVDESEPVYATVQDLDEVFSALSTARTRRSSGLGGDGEPCFDNLAGVFEDIAAL